MSRIAFAAPIAVCCALAAAAALAQSPMPQSDVAQGRDLYETHCELCHGADGRGDGPLADELRAHPADLTGIAQRRAGTFPEVEVREIIDGRRPVRGHGGKEMPIWGRALAGKETDPKAREAALRAKIDALVAYLRSIQASPPRSVGMR